MNTLPPPPALLPMTHIDYEVGALVTLGMGPHGERRYVRLGGGTVSGPALNCSLPSRLPEEIWNSPRALHDQPGRMASSRVCRETSKVA